MRNITQKIILISSIALFCAKSVYAETEYNSCETRYNAINTILNSSQQAVIDAIKLAKKYRSKLACYETVTDAAGNTIKCEGGAK
jgi:hypothetical protein